MSKKSVTPTQPGSSPKDNHPPASVAFIHNFLDEYGLDPYEWRVYSHMVRRTGGKPEGVCFASLSKTAKICKMSTRKVQQALKVLIKANLLEQNKRTGRTDEYRVTPASTWVSREELDRIRQSVMGIKQVTSTELDTEIDLVANEGLASSLALPQV